MPTILLWWALLGRRSSANSGDHNAGVSQLAFECKPIALDDVARPSARKPMFDGDPGRLTASDRADL